MDKRCFKCRKKKPLDQFYKHKEMADGHLNKCKLCTKKDVKRRYYDPESRQTIREYEKKRFQTPERKSKILEYQKKRRLTYPGKYKARYAITNGVKNGHIIRLPCEVCGRPESQAHHTDYRKPTAVKWLCFKHHREEHGQIVG